ncbi:hypothetical protein Taro_005707 [Colocasia esculenta]|uniref:Uncharacterized protein n=1 Tax=Colocasia esculenta TaxID=4460 RepID=A0A843TNY3_COLES|nr:hypothetical protein [Colocasia esculenta]
MKSLVRNPMSGLTPVRVRRRQPEGDASTCHFLGHDCDSHPVATKKATGETEDELYTQEDGNDQKVRLLDCQLKHDRSLEYFLNRLPRTGVPGNGNNLSTGQALKCRALGDD